MERGYHVFYFMLRGMDEAALKKLELCDAAGKRQKWEYFTYLKTGGDLPEKHDIEGWKDLIGTV
jgi:myosin heavy subunit